MPEEWFEIAYINFEKAILHGRIMADMEDLRCRREVYIEQVLTAEQKAQVQSLSDRHDREMQRLLTSLLDREAALAGDPQ